MLEYKEQLGRKAFAEKYLRYIPKSLLFSFNFESEDRQQYLTELEAKISAMNFPKISIDPAQIVAMCEYITQYAPQGKY